MQYYMLPKPKFETRVIEKDRLYCQIFFIYCLFKKYKGIFYQLFKKHKGRNKLEKITEQASNSSQKNGKALTINTTKYLVLQIGITLMKNMLIKSVKVHFLKNLNSQRLTENYPNENSQKKNIFEGIFPPGHNYVTNYKHIRFLVYRKKNK